MGFEVVCFPGVCVRVINLKKIVTNKTFGLEICNLTLGLGF